VFGCVCIGRVYLCVWLCLYRPSVFAPVLCEFSLNVKASSQSFASINPVTHCCNFM